LAVQHYSTKLMQAKNVQGKEQHTINHYFNQSQAKGKERETAQKKGELQYMDKFENCIENAENNDMKSLIGKFTF